MPINGVWHSFASFYQDVDILDNKEGFFFKSRLNLFWVKKRISVDFWNNIDEILRQHDKARPTILNTACTA